MLARHGRTKRRCAAALKRHPAFKKALAAYRAESAPTRAGAEPDPETDVIDPEAPLPPVDDPVVVDEPVTDEPVTPTE